MKISRVDIQTKTDPQNEMYLTINGIAIPGAQAVSTGNCVDDECQEVQLVLCANQVTFSTEEVDSDDEQPEPEPEDEDVESVEDEEDQGNCAGCTDTDCPSSPAYEGTALPPGEATMESLLETIKTQQEFIEGSTRP
jgi:hypothetical protein